VRGMLPKTKLGEAMWRKLKVYPDASHPHQAQKPKALAVGKGSAKNVKDNTKMTKREVA
jgi:ribosomal protein L13